MDASLQFEILSLVRFRAPALAAPLAAYTTTIKENQKSK